MLRNVKREIEWSMNETEADSWGEVYDALVTKLKTFYD
jgi:predicted AAA+ superfamily ATPase